MLGAESVSWRDMRLRLSVFVATAIATMGVSFNPAACLAQSSQPNPAAEAESCIERGVAARVRGDDDGALREFQSAYRLTPTARVQAQIALAEQALGRWSDAERDLLAALDVRTDPWIARNDASLRQSLTQIQARLSSLDVRVDVAAAEIFINQRSAGAAPLARPLRVAWGTVTIEVRAVGYVTQRRTIEVASGAMAREEFALVRDESTPSRSGSTNTVATPRSATELSVLAAPPARTIAWAGPVIVGSVGASTLVASTVFAALRQGAYDACPYSAGRMGLECTTSDSYSRASMGPTWTTATNVTLVAGGALVVGAGVWLTINAVTTRPRESASGRASLWVAPTFASNSIVGLSVGGAL